VTSEVGINGYIIMSPLLEPSIFVWVADPERCTREAWVLFAKSSQGIVVIMISAMIVRGNGPLYRNCSGPYKRHKEYKVI
jgi:hypothetical protein